MTSSFFHTHVHSRYSAVDGMTSVSRLVEKAKDEEQPALALTDHGYMAGAVELYQGCKEAGLVPFPGIEAYLIDPEVENWESPGRGEKVGRYHLGLLALSYEGYKGLVKLSSLSHTRPRFNRFPRLSLNDLASFGKEYGDHVALTTGCYFGWYQQMMVRVGKEEAAKVLAVYSSWFPHTFVELQNHGIEHDTMGDDDICAISIELARQMRLPVVVGQDSHYCDLGEKRAHDLMKRMVYRGSEDDVFPGDSFHLASTDWMKGHFTSAQWRAALDGCAQLLDLSTIDIKPLNSFRADVPRITKDPTARLESMTKASLVKYLEKIGANLKVEKQYTDRWNYELDVIAELGMEQYFVIVKDFIDWCADERICVEARGSANGSLVCFLLNITQVDPIKWGTMFDRFLSTDRIKPPDIDIDIEDSRRPEAIKYFKDKYGAVQIGTWSLLGTYTDRDTGEDRGSVIQTWLQGKRAELEVWAADRHDTKKDAAAHAAAVFQKKYGHVKSLEDVRAISETDAASLQIILAMNSVCRSHGTHAGGVLLSGRRVKIEDYIPTMLVASSDTTVTQFDMDHVELFGLLKMDVLGQATLRVMRLAQEMIGVDNPLDFTWIPDDDREACAILRSGRPKNGIFHFEGYTKAKGGKEMGIRSTADAILASALFMPGAMDTGQTDHYLRMRRDPRARRQVTYLHPVFERVLSPTYGAVVFQEQVIDIMRGLGMDIGGINKFFKVVKDSGRGATERNQQRLAEVRDQFRELCHANGITDVDGAWGQTAGFVAYGFNKNHATGYGIRSYRCAYLMAHHNLEFLTALLEVSAGKDREPQYVAEARRQRVPLLPPHVNISGPNWTLDTKNNAIRRGLMSIKGIGAATAESVAAHAPFESIRDMIERVPPRAMTGGKDYLIDGTVKGTVQKLLDADALEGL